MNSSSNNSNVLSNAGNSGSLVSSVCSAMFSARSAQARWATTPLRERLVRIRELRRLIAEHAHVLAEASAFARQRPTLESLTSEVLPLAEACRFLEQESTALLAPRRLGFRGLPLWLSGVRSEIRRDPFGVVLIIGPGNYPLLLPGVQLIQALVAGNAVLLKPGVGGSLAARTLVEIIHRAGFDSDLVTLLPESADAARAAIEAGPDKVIFTGSAATGEKILAQLAPQLIPATMELSGCDAVIVRADADLDLTVKALTFGLTLNNGGTCMAPKRVLVHRSIATELEGRLARSFPRSSRGDEVFYSSQKDRSFLTSAATHQLRPLLEEAIGQGAHFITGGFMNDGSIQTPVILAGLAPSARLLREDIFAPVLALVTVVDDAEAAARANDCPYALGTSIFSRDEAVARSIATSLNAGVITINDVIIPTADARLPFGGRKRSGFGVTRGAEGLLQLTVIKVVTVSRGKFRPAFDPPAAKDEAMFQAYLELTHGHGLANRARALITLFISLSGRKKSPRKRTP